MFVVEDEDTVKPDFPFSKRFELIQVCDHSKQPGYSTALRVLLVRFLLRTVKEWICQSCLA